MGRHFSRSEIEDGSEASGVRTRRAASSALLVALAAILIVGQPPLTAGAAKKATKPTTPARSAVPRPEVLTVSKSLLDGKTVVRRTPLASSAKTVVIEGRGPIAVGELASAGLASHHARTQQLRSVRSALLADPVEIEEVVETADGTTIRSTTTITVVDPTAVGNAVAGFRRTVPTSNVWANKWELSEFDAFKVTLGSKPDNHPLKQAMQRGDQALKSAVAAGQGDMSVTTELFFPAASVEVKNQSAAVPVMRNGRFDYTQSKTVSMNLLPPTPRSTGALPNTQPTVQRSSASRSRSVTTTTTRSRSGGASSERVKAKPVTKQDNGTPTGGGGGGGGTGSSGGGAAESPNGAMEFLTGFTEGDSFEWEETWDLGPGSYVSIGAHAWYGIGLRIPVEVTADLSPRQLVDDDGVPGANYETSLTARAFDADAGFYQRTGLDADLVYAGKEFVLEVGAFATVEGQVLFGATFKEKFGKEIDWGDQVRPPWGSCGTNCGVDLWVPASLTHTEVSIPSIATGKAELGFNLGGTGEVALNYRSIDNGSPVASTFRGTTATDQPWKNDGVASGGTFRTELSPGSFVNGRQRSFGYSVSDTTYTWNIKVTPGVRGSISVFGLGEFGIGPFWLHPFAFDLGRVTFPHHEGTTNSYERTPGTYTPPQNAAAIIPATSLVRATIPATPTSTAPSGGSNQRRRTSTTTTALPTTTPSAGTAGVAGRVLKATEVVGVLAPETVEKVKTASDWIPITPKYQSTGVKAAALGRLQAAPIECRFLPTPACRNPKNGVSVPALASSELVRVHTTSVRVAWTVQLKSPVATLLFGVSE